MTDEYKQKEICRVLEDVLERAKAGHVERLAMTYEGSPGGPFGRVFIDAAQPDTFRLRGQLLHLLQFGTR